MIRKDGPRYLVLSHDGRRLGSYQTRAEAERRLRQIEAFKHMDAKKGRGG